MEEQNCLILGILTPSFEEETGGVKEREGIQRRKQEHEHCCFYQEKKDYQRELRTLQKRGGLRIH
jgi:hypothetical protein